MVTSTSTPGSILMEVICLTVSEGLCRSMSRMWILIWNRSQVLEPSPQGVFLVVILSLGWHPNWSFGFEILFLRASNQVSTHLLQRLHFAAGEGDPNPVNGHLWLHGSLAGVFKGHGCGVASWPTCSSARANTVSQEQERAEHRAAATATASSSKSPHLFFEAPSSLPSESCVSIIFFLNCFFTFWLH